MTKLTYNIFCFTNNKVIAHDLTSLPRARQAAEEIGNCEVRPVYTQVELKDEYPLPKKRLSAFI